MSKGNEFVGEHVFFTADGLLERIACQSCGATVAALEEVPSLKFPGRTLTTMKLFPNLLKGEVELSDGSLATVFLCTDCRSVSPADYAEKVVAQIKRGWEKELEANGRPESEVAALRAKNKDLAVLRNRRAV